MRKLLTCLTLLVCLSFCAWEPASAREAVCHKISNPDAFINNAASKSAVMTIVHADEFGKAAGYKDGLIAVFILPDDETLITVSKGSECFTSVHEDDDTWRAVQKFFGRGA